MTLPKNVKIPGVTGILHPLWGVRLKGIWDGKSQVRQVEGGYSTPYIERIYGCLHSAVSKKCRETVNSLETVFTEVGRSTQELLTLQKPLKLETLPPGDDGQRIAAARAARQRANQMRTQELAIRLEELREIIQTADECLGHWCRQAFAETNIRLSSYWDGVLRSSSEKGLPPFPLEGERDILSLTSIRRQIGGALAQISLALSEFEKGEDQNDTEAA